MFGTKNVYFLYNFRLVYYWKLHSTAALRKKEYQDLILGPTGGLCKDTDVTTAAQWHVPHVNPLNLTRKRSLKIPLPQNPRDYDLHRKRPFSVWRKVMATQTWALFSLFVNFVLTSEVFFNDFHIPELTIGSDSGHREGWLDSDVSPNVKCSH